MENKADARNIVLNMLSDTLQKGNLSHNVTGAVFACDELSGRDRGFILNLYLGVLERLPLLDYNIEKRSKTPSGKIKPVVKNILRMGLYQMYFMDSVPERAAISESLRLLEKRKLAGLKGFANGILRTIQREGLLADAPEHINYCAPKWLYEKLCGDIGKEEAQRFLCCSLNRKNTLTALFNTQKAPKEEIIGSLEEEGCRAYPAGTAENAYFLEIEGRLEDLNAFKNGYIYIQSLNSMKVALKAKELYEKAPAGGVNPLIMDVCACPGGKSIGLALAFPDGRIISGDKSKNKTDLIEENIARMGLKNIETRVHDAAVFDEKYKETADIVIVDAPCSGLGVIPEKPDIKTRIKREDIESLSALQRQILKACAGYAKPKGILIYSTCTLTKEENGENSKWLEDTGIFKSEGSSLYTVNGDRADGFYIAAFRKN